MHSTGRVIAEETAGLEAQLLDPFEDKVLPEGEAAPGVAADTDPGLFTRVLRAGVKLSGFYAMGHRKPRKYFNQGAP